MLRITASMSAAGAKKYFGEGLERPDYYMDGQEVTGLWGGEGAKRLGLRGEVDRESYFSLCDNLHPHTNERLTPRTKDTRRVGYDFTFSASKSVSVLYEHSVYEQTHPPFALRMNSIVEHAKGLFRRTRPKLLESPMTTNLGAYLRAVGDVTWSMNGGVTWDDDIAFIRTPEGQRYTRELEVRLNRLKDELEERARATHSS